MYTVTGRQFNFVDSISQSLAKDFSGSTRPSRLEVEKFNCKPTDLLNCGLQLKLNIKVGLIVEMLQRKLKMR